MTTTTGYGTWTTRVHSLSNSPDSDILDFINGGDADWRELLEESGALERIQSEYVDAINDALPAGVFLVGTEFIGPYYEEDCDFDGYPTDEDGQLDIRAIVEKIDLGPIVDRNDPLTLEDIGRNELKSTAKEPEKAASKAMSRLGVKPFTYHPHPESGRPQALFLAGEVRAALAARPGKGVGGGRRVTDA